MQASTSSAAMSTREKPQFNLLAEMKLFIKDSSAPKCHSVDFLKTSMSLLKTLPAARTAILEYLRGEFDNAAMNYIHRIETEINTGQLFPPNEQDETKLSEVHSVLCGFVSNNAEAWAPIISTWSLELLGEISTRYSGRARISGLNETLQLWMNCRATRTLIDITTQCLSCLMHSDTEACINALLDTSVKHSPNFDWVVAHVGSCFPQTVIVRVLSCGLKDFCQNKSYQQGCDSPKLKSVIGILGHLATSHCYDIKKALIDLFNWCLLDTSFQEGEIVRNQKKAAVPFLLHLLTLSPTLLNALCDEIKNMVPISVILKLYHMINDWCKYFGSSEALQDLLINLILKCEKGGVQIINLLLDCIFLKKLKLEENEIKIHDIVTTSRDLLESILCEIDYTVRYHSYYNRKSINILNSLILDIEDIYNTLLSNEQIKSQTAARILIFIGQENPAILIQACSFILENAKTDFHLAYLVRIINDELVDKTIPPYCDKGGHFSVLLEQMLDKNYIRMDGITTSEISDLDQMWANLLTLLKWEKLDTIFVLKSKCISKGIEMNLLELTELFKNEMLTAKSSHVLCEILNLMEVPSGNSTCSLPLQVLLNFVNGTINYFFLCCEERDEITRICGFNRVTSIFKKLSMYSKISRNLALRLLLERSLYSKESQLFGAKMNDFMMITGENSKHLLIQNKKISKTIHLTKHSSVYNGGIIGNGKRKSLCAYQPHLDYVSSNTEHLINVIRACCSVINDNQSVKASDILLDSVTLVSLMLVQLVSPDVMYNGLPWPEEEFSKVTIERDLLIRRLFNNTPLLWDLLSFVALHRPALCYCSVLIRALTASLLHQWTSMGDQSKSTDAENYKALMTTTVKVIDVISLGQLLPAPLSNVRDVVPYLSSHEIVAILRECIWFYMRDHIPSPALFIVDSNGLYWRDPSMSRAAEIYTKTLRTVMQRNIKTVGHLFSCMFITIPKDD